MKELKTMREKQRGKQTKGRRNSFDYVKTSEEMAAGITKQSRKRSGSQKKKKRCSSRVPDDSVGTEPPSQLRRESRDNRVVKGRDCSEVRSGQDACRSPEPSYHREEQQIDGCWSSVPLSPFSMTDAPAAPASAFKTTECPSDSLPNSNKDRFAKSESLKKKVSSFKYSLLQENPFSVRLGLQNGKFRPESDQAQSGGNANGVNAATRNAQGDDTQGVSTVKEISRPQRRKKRAKDSAAATTRTLGRDSDEIRDHASRPSRRKESIEEQFTTNNENQEDDSSLIVLVDHDEASVPAVKSGVKEQPAKNDPTQGGDEVQVVRGVQCASNTPDVDKRHILLDSSPKQRPAPRKRSKKKDKRTSLANTMEWERNLPAVNTLPTVNMSSKQGSTRHRSSSSSSNAKGCIAEETIGVKKAEQALSLQSQAKKDERARVYAIDEGEGGMTTRIAEDTERKGWKQEPYELSSCSTRKNLEDMSKAHLFQGQRHWYDEPNNQSTVAVYHARVEEQPTGTPDKQWFQQRMEQQEQQHLWSLILSSTPSEIKAALSCTRESRKHQEKTKKSRKQKEDTLAIGRKEHCLENYNCFQCSSVPSVDTCVEVIGEEAELRARSFASENQEFLREPSTSHASAKRSRIKSSMRTKASRPRKEVRFSSPLSKGPVGATGNCLEGETHKREVYGRRELQNQLSSDMRSTKELVMAPEQPLHQSERLKSYSERVRRNLELLKRMALRDVTTAEGCSHGCPYISGGGHFASELLGELRRPSFDWEGLKERFPKTANHPDIVQYLFCHATSMLLANGPTPKETVWERVKLYIKGATIIGNMRMMEANSGLLTEEEEKLLAFRFLRWHPAFQSHGDVLLELESRLPCKCLEPMKTSFFCKPTKLDCTACGKPHTPTIPCSDCGFAQYCSKECKETNYSEHKYLCMMFAGKLSPEQAQAAWEAEISARK